MTKQNLPEFAALVVNIRLNESRRQMASIRKGLNQVVPVRILSLFTWSDLEVMVCGQANIDIELLRKHTVYQGLSASSPEVKFLWKALHSLTAEEKQRFLRFVWGRNRLPTTDDDWTTNFTLKSIATSTDALPIAHTCFFSMDLPPYSSYKLCREKILYAVYNCQAIDLDFNPSSSSLSAWIDTE